MEKLNEQLDGRAGEAAQEAALRELIRAVVASAFGAVLILGVGGVKVRRNLVSYEPNDGR